MLKRQNVKNSKQVKVTFVVPHDPDQPRMYVVGDFNDWSATADLLVKRSNNTRSTATLLEKNKRYAFRYCTEDGEWFNDEAADAYEANDLGGENCIVIT